MKLLEALQWRYATKRYKKDVQLDQKKVMQIIEAARLAPTSSGLQPFEMILITNQQVKQDLAEIGMNQAQITESSALLIFACWDSYSEQRIDKVFAHMEATRNMEVGEMNDYKNSIKASFAKKSPQEQIEHAARQSYIAFGMAIAAAAELQIDASPMEGFHNHKLDAFLKLDQRGLKSMTILALGERDLQNDWLVPLKKVRFALEDILTIIK